MTAPTVFSDVAGTATNTFSAKSEPQGVLAQKFVLTLAAAVAADTNCALIRFQKGFSLTDLSLVATDMDTATTLVLDVGYLYDGTTGEDDNAFFNDLDIGQDAGSVIWPIADGLLTGTSFVATGPGYLTLTTRGEAIEVAGTVTGIAKFTYDLQGLNGYFIWAADITI